MANNGHVWHCILVRIGCSPYNGCRTNPFIHYQAIEECLLVFHHIYKYPSMSMYKKISVLEATMTSEAWSYTIWLSFRGNNEGNGD